MKQDFENYLKEIHASGYMGTDDDMGDRADTWIENLDVQELIDFADHYGKSIAKQVKENILKEIKEFALETYPSDDGSGVVQNIIEKIEKL